MREKLLDMVTKILREGQATENAELVVWANRVGGELKQAQELGALAAQEVARRMLLADDKKSQESFESARSLIAKAKAAIGTLVPMQVASTKAILAELKQSGDSCLNAVGELGRRSSSADIAHSEMVPRVKTAEASLAAIKAESVAESAAASEKLQTVRSSLKQAQKQHGAAVEELARRVRMAAL